MSTELGWETLSGMGAVYSFTIVRRTPSKGFQALVPYVYAIVELEEGPRLPTNIVGCAVDQVAVGQPVEAVFDSAGEGLGLLRFRPR